ncbi:hypothetical protein LTR67_006813 [Exophiala xenobiotica]
MSSKSFGSLITCYRLSRPNNGFSRTVVRQYLTRFPRRHRRDYEIARNLENTGLDGPLSSPPQIVTALYLKPRSAASIETDSITAPSESNTYKHPHNSKDGDGEAQPNYGLLSPRPPFPRPASYPRKSSRSQSTPGSFDPSPNWQTRFGETWNNLHKQLIFPEDNDLSKARERLKKHRLVAASFVRYPDVQTLHAAWLDTPLSTRQELLPSILAGCLADSARKTLMMLTVLKVVPRDWRTRCYLDLVHREEIDAHSDLQNLFSKQVELVSRVRTWPKAGGFPPAFLALLLRHNGEEQCRNIIDRVVARHMTVPVPLILIMVDHFTKAGDANRAVEMLSRIPVEQRKHFHREMLDRFGNLIKLDTIVETDGVRNFQLLPRLMDFGITMDANIHNLIIERAIALGRPAVAWELFRFMEAEGIHVDARRHLLLLRDSFDRDDRDHLDKIMSAIHRREDLYDDPYLVTYMMHIIGFVCRIDRQLSAESSVSHVVAIYDRAYSRVPLVKLGLIEALPAERASQQPPPEPPPAVLAFTIWAFTLCQTDERQVSRWWHWIVHMIKQQDRSVCEAATHDVLYNGFIHFYSRHRSTVDKALGVVQEMIDLQLCIPTQRTWSEILCGFLRHAEDETALKIWRNMLSNQKRSSKPGWEFLLTRFDKSLLADEIKDVLNERRMPEGFEPTFGGIYGATPESPEARQAATI